MFKNDVTPKEAARIYKEAGLTPLALKPMAKNPVLKNWNKAKQEDLDKAFDKDNYNVGVRADEFADIDVDCPEGILPCDTFLPKTDCVFGRASLGSITHRMYSFKEATPKFEVIKDPIEGDTMLEMRTGASRQTMMPPSRIPTKEEAAKAKKAGKFAGCSDQVLFSNPGLPTKVEDTEAFVQAFRLSGAVALLTRYWPAEGGRQDAMLRLAGGLITRMDWTEDQVVQFCLCVAKGAGDQDLKERLTAIKGTFQKKKDGENITGWASLKEIIDERIIKEVTKLLGIKAQSSGGTPGIVIEDGCYWSVKISKAGVDYTQLTNFLIKPQQFIEVPEEGHYMKALLLHSSGEKAVMIPPKAWTGARLFKEWLAESGHSFMTSFTGTDKELTQIHMALPTEGASWVKGTNLAGFVDGHFVTESGALNQYDEIQSSLVYIGNHSSHCKLNDVVAPKDEELENVGWLIDKFNSKQVALPVIGWTAACFYKDWIMELGNGFPVLNCEGGAGSGKTTTSERLINAVWAMDQAPKAIANMTRFVQIKVLSSSHCPQVLDEYKPGRMTLNQVNGISAMIRESYNGLEGSRGTQSQKVMRYRLEAPYVICGETGFEEAAIVDRTVLVSFSERESRKYTTEFQKLIDLELGKLGKRLLLDRLGTKKEDFEDLWNSEMEMVDARLKDRPRVNACAVRVGLRMLEAALGVELEVDVIDEVVRQATFGGSKDDEAEYRKSEVDKTLDALLLMSDYQGESAREYRFSEYLCEDVHYSVKGDELRIWVAGAMPVFNVWAQKYKFEGDKLDRMSFLRQIKLESYYVDNNRAVKLGNGKVKKCLILDIAKMKRKRVFSNLECVVNDFLEVVKKD